MAESNSDHALVQRVLAGERRATDEFVTRAQLVTRVLGARNRNAGRPLSDEDLKDAAQDVFAEICRRLKDFPQNGVLDRWLYHFCHYTFLARYRGALRKRHFPLPDVPPLAAEESEFHAHDRALVLSTLDRLPAAERELIDWRYLEELSFEAMGARLGVPTGTARDRFLKAFHHVRRLLEPRFEPRSPERRGDVHEKGADA